MSYYRKKVYDSHNGDSGLNARTGQVVEVLRELTDREADIADVGRMFHVRFADGFETDVFEDELEVHDTVKIIVDGTNTRWLILFLSAMSSGTSATIWQTDICRFARLAGLMAVR